MNAAQCKLFNSVLFRRIPDWDKRLYEDRHPWNYLYHSLYEQKTFASFTGDTHFFDTVHITRPNDDGCWEPINVDACAMNICDTDPQYVCWGSTRKHYGMFRRQYRTPVLCLDQLRHIEEAEAQLEAIVKGLKRMPNEIISNFIRMLVLRQAGTLHICGSALTELAVTPNMFSANCRRLDLGGVGNLPTSKLTMNYLDHHVTQLQMEGYFDTDFLPQGTFLCTADIQTHRDMANQNPTLAKMYTGADFEKGSAYYEYGIMHRVGNWVFKIDEEPLKFQHVGNGVLEPVLPFVNTAATVGKKPVFDRAYLEAPYQMFHVINRAAREMYVGDMTPVNPEMKFKISRNLMGQWSWKSPDGTFRGVDPATGNVCWHDNTLGNRGFFLGEFEMGTKTIYPDIEMVIIAQVEPQCVTDLARCKAEPAQAYQDLTPYCDGCWSAPSAGQIAEETEPEFA